MLENLFPDMPLFDKKAGKSVTDRLNMGRLYIFNIFGAAGVLLFFAVLKLFGIHIFPRKYQTLAFLTTVFIFLLSAAAVLFTTRTRRTELFDKVCYAYLFVFSAILYNFAFKATSDAAAIVFYWIVMIVIGCLPVLRPEAFLAVWAIDLIPAVILAWVRGFPAATNTALVTIGIMGLGLSLALYSNTIRKLDYKLRLDSALSEAETDPMTLLLNRRGLDRRTENIWPYCIRQKSHVAIMMIDIDNFKKYNDTYGHAAGDECIRKVTAAIRRNVKRRTDYAARVGGEEFLVMLTGIEPKLAVKWALDLKKSIDSLKIPHADTNFNPYVSVSMGVACAEVTEGVTFEKIREEADKSLYEAKYNGRACIYYHHRAFGKPGSSLKKTVGQ
ncbi:MAG: GGDEF domain-containing protein [Lachnospiraceae bacterium]|nr:GGDEF domain-containing protein [Lachnospiraceae bacterium]